MTLLAGESNNVEQARIQAKIQLYIPISAHIENIYIRVSMVV